MKKIPFLFLVSLTIFVIFIIISLFDNQLPISSPSTFILPATSTAKPTRTVIKTLIPTQPKLTACIITINGQRYDVTQFRLQHSGGNIFNCNTDMSAIFTNQHSQSYLNQMKAYLVH